MKASLKPCRYSEEEVHSMGLEALERAKQGLGIPHDEAKKIAASYPQRIPVFN